MPSETLREIFTKKGYTQHGVVYDRHGIYYRVFNPNNTTSQLIFTSDEVQHYYYETPDGKIYYGDDAANLLDENLLSEIEAARFRNKVSEIDSQTETSLGLKNPENIPDRLTILLKTQKDRKAFDRNRTSRRRPGSPFD